MTDSTALTITRHLPVKLDQYRERALTNEMVKERMEEIRITDHLKNVSEALKASIKEAQKKQTIAAVALNQGFEMCAVSCEQRPDVEKNKMVTYRLDTGAQIDERALTVEEMKEARKLRKA
jgi:hypothetical protein